MFWSRIEWPSRADLSQWPNGQQNCLSAYPVLHRTELPNWKKMRQQTGKNDILWSYPATSLPICVTRKSVIKVNKKELCLVSLSSSPCERSIFCNKHASMIVCKSPCTARHSTVWPWASSTSGSAPQQGSLFWRNKDLPKDNEHLRQDMKHRITWNGRFVPVKSTTT